LDLPGATARQATQAIGLPAGPPRRAERAKEGHVEFFDGVLSTVGEVTVDKSPDMLHAMSDEASPLTSGPLSSLDRSTLRERALEALRSAIIVGRYRPGDHLGEVELATHLGVSRGTVREALRHLQQEGLVTAGNRGMLRVNTLSSEEVRELYQVRAVLEGLAAARIIGSPKRDAAIAALRGSLSQLSEAGDFLARVEADLGFHLLLCELAGNSMLVDAWRHLEGRMRVTIMSGDADQLPRIMSGDHHAPIVDAIQRGDVTAAVDVVGQHMTAAAEQLAGRRAAS
jgi:DNA-binding GntR family transcriptional regulator